MVIFSSLKNYDDINDEMAFLAMLSPTETENLKTVTLPLIAQLAREKHE
jgi:hypothetical protein